MATRAGTGISHHRNPKIAGKEAVRQALAKAGIDRPDFVFMFASVGYPQAVLLEAVWEAAGKVPLSGCSGEGVIIKHEADESNFSVAVMVVSSDEIRFENGIATQLKRDSAMAGRDVAKQVGTVLSSDTIGLFVLPDGLTINFDRFLEGLEGHLEQTIPVFGGTSADNWVFEKTYQYFNNEVFSDAAAWVLLSGELRVASSVNHGCVPIGGKRTVTRCQDNMIFEIDNRPVLNVLKEYLVGEEIDNWAKAVINLCLGFRAPSYMKDYDEFLIRFIPSKDDEKGAISIPTRVSTGQDIWMTRRDPDRISKGIDRIIEDIKTQLGEHEPKLIFQFDCCGRGKVVFREQQKLELLKKMQKALGEDIPWLGFFTLGEIGPVGGHNCFHNYTVVLAALY